MTGHAIAGLIGLLLGGSTVWGWTVLQGDGEAPSRAEPQLGSHHGRVEPVPDSEAPCPPSAATAAAPSEETEDVFTYWTMEGEQSCDGECVEALTTRLLYEVPNEAELDAITQLSGPIAALIEGDASLRSDFRRMLARVRDEETAYAVMSVASLGGVTLRIEAAETFLRSVDDTVRPLGIELAMRDASGDIRAKALVERILLRERDGPALERVLDRAFMLEPGTLSPSSELAIESIARSHPDGALRSAALATYAYVTQNSPRAIDLLEEGLQSDDPQQRMASVFILSQSASGEERRQRFIQYKETADTIADDPNAPTERAFRH